mmetsp:Transcript_26011/g.77143  ORF Transcript_26011/g.77143 Transcript_26011/m.77143 type:complete len:354 (+) Transcript_26011:403-1464(+)
MNSPASCLACTKSMPCVRSSDGDSRMSLWRMNAEHARRSSGNRLSAMRSNLPWSLGDTQYHHLGAPKCMKLIESRSASSLCQPKNERHMPKYVIGVVTPGTSGTSLVLSRSPRSRRFQPYASRSSKNEIGVSAPYSGGFSVTPLQNARSIRASASEVSPLSSVSLTRRLSPGAAINSSAACRWNVSTSISFCSTRMHRYTPLDPNTCCRMGVLIWTFLRSGNCRRRARHPGGGTTLNIANSGFLPNTSLTKSVNGRWNCCRVGRSVGHHRCEPCCGSSTTSCACTMAAACCLLGRLAAAAAAPAGAAAAVAPPPPLLALGSHARKTTPHCFTMDTRPRMHMDADGHTATRSRW